MQTKCVSKPLSWNLPSLWGKYIFILDYLYIFLAPDLTFHQLYLYIAKSPWQYDKSLAVELGGKVKLARPDNLLPPGEGLQCIIACQTLKACIAILLKVCSAPVPPIEIFFEIVRLALYLITVNHKNLFWIWRL